MQKPTRHDATSHPLVGSRQTSPKPALHAPALPHKTIALQVDAHSICPGCGNGLVDRGCKMRCLRCGFFLDCSDG